MLKTLENLQLSPTQVGFYFNGRDSQAKRLGAKAADGQTLSGGSILYRQRGTQYLPRCKRRPLVVTIHSSAKVEDVVRF